MGNLEFNQEVGLHNKFHIVATDVRTGEVTQEARAENIILKEGFDKILAGLLYRTNTGNSGDYRLMRPNRDIITGNKYRYGGYIHIGTGVGTISASRTELFEFYKGFYGGLHDRGWNQETMSGYYTLKVTIPPGEQYPSAISEVGLASFSNKTDLSTHALLEDSEGEQVFLSPGPYDQLTIYATNYITLNQPTKENVAFVEGTLANGNFFQSIFVGNASPSYQINEEDKYAISIGTDDSEIDLENNSVVTPFLIKNLKYNSPLVSFDRDLRRIKFDGIRFTPNEGNSAQGVREIGVTWYMYDDERNALFRGMIPVFRSVLPIPGVWTGKAIEDEEVGTGDGAKTVFNLKWPDIVLESEEIYVQGRSPELQARGTDYTMTDPETSEITFAVPPASGAAITANYRVDYIPKDENHVLDISFTFSFKDANAE